MRALGNGIQNYYGAITLSAAPGNIGLTVNGVSSQAAAYFTGGSTSGSSFGVAIAAGTTAADYPLSIRNQATSTLWQFQGDGSLVSSGLTSGGAGSINAASLYINSNPLYVGIPLNTLAAANYQTVLSDASKMLFQNSTGHTITLPSNAVVAYPVGTTISFLSGAGVTTTIAATDTMYWSATGGTGSRTLSTTGMATAYRVSTGAWIISGSGLS